MSAIDTAVRAVLAAWDSTVLPVANDGRLHEAMEQLRHSMEAQPAEPSRLKPGQHVIRYNGDGEFGQATGWLHREGGEPCAVTGKPVYVWRPLSTLLATTGHEVTRKGTQQPAEPVAWAPYLSDRADGVRGHYAIARWNPRGYREVWNLRLHRWASASDGVMRLEEAASLLRQIEIPTRLATSPAAPAAQPHVVAEVLAELAKAVAKFPTWPTDPLHALAVLGEEFGELTKDVLQLCYEPHKTTPESARTEAMQTAAMALRFAMSLARYEYRPGAQHAQGHGQGGGNG